MNCTTHFNLKPLPSKIFDNKKGTDLATGSFSNQFRSNLLLGTLA